MHCELHVTDEKTTTSVALTASHLERITSVLCFCGARLLLYPPPLVADVHPQPHSVPVLHRPLELEDREKPARESCAS